MVGGRGIRKVVRWRWAPRNSKFFYLDFWLFLLRQRTRDFYLPSLFRLLLVFTLGHSQSLATFGGFVNYFRL